MRLPITFLWRLLDDRRGATVVEYGLIVALVILTMFGAIQSVGSTTANMWNNISSAVINTN